MLPGPSSPSGQRLASGASFLPRFGLLLATLLAGIRAAAGADAGPAANQLTEMQRAMREAQQALQNLDPQLRQQLQQAMQQAGAPAGASDDDAPPADRSAELAGISRQPLAPAALKSFVDRLPDRIAPALAPAARQRAEIVDAEAKRQGADYLETLRLAANGLGAIGAWPEALWLTTKLARTSGDAQDLSNLAAMLTLLHAESGAIPILHTLAARYPGNSTVLNNLGQAYYQLGASEEAEKHLIAAIRRSPNHPQANATRARIQLARGDQAGAQASLHAALQGGYSPSKESQLRESGGEPTRADLAWKLPLPADPLGVGSTKPSIYPESVDQLPALIELEKATRAEAKEKGEQYMQRAAAIPPPSLAGVMAASRMPHHDRVKRLIQLDNEANRPKFERLQQQGSELTQRLVTEKQKMDQQIAAIDEKGRQQYRDRPGGYQFDYTCGEVKKVVEVFLTQLVPAYRAYEAEYADLLRRDVGDRTYWSQFVLPAGEFQREQLAARAGLMRGPVGAVPVLDAVSGLVQQRRIACWSGEVPKGKRGGPLRDFNNLHPMLLAELTVPLIGSMRFFADRTEVSLKPTLAPFEVAWSTKDTGRGDETRLLGVSAAISVSKVKVGGHSEFDADGWKSGGVTAEITQKLGTVGSGPLEIGVEAGGTVSLEFDRKGLSDVVVDVGITSKNSGTVAKTDAGGHLQGELKVSAGSSFSYNAGYNSKVSQEFKSSAFGK